MNSMPSESTPIQDAIVSLKSSNTSNIMFLGTNKKEVTNTGNKKQTSGSGGAFCFVLVSERRTATTTKAASKTKFFNRRGWSQHKTFKTGEVS